MVLKSTPKPKTNEESLKALLMNLDAVEQAFLVERILFVMELTINSIKEEPEIWERSFVHPNVYIRLNEKVQKHLS